MSVTITITDNDVVNVITEPETPTLAQVLAAGAIIEEDTTIDIAGNILGVYNGVDELILIDPTQGDARFGYKKGLNFGHHRAGANEFGAQFSSRADFNDGEKYCEIIGSASGGFSQLEYTAEKHRFRWILEFDDNAAAIAGGLEPTMLYRRTAGGLDIVTA